MRIAVIGTGGFGSVLARALVGAGHSVVLSARHPEHASKVASDVGAEAAGSNVEAIDGADIVVLAVPSTAVASIADEIQRHVAGKIVVDTTNPVKPDLTGLLDAEGSVAEAAQVLLPDATLIKAFNTIFAARLNDPVIDGIPLDGCYAGNDDAAKAKVAELLSSMGFRPMDAGPLVAARLLEELALLNMSLNMRNKWSWQTGWKLLGPTG